MTATGDCFKVIQQPQVVETLQIINNDLTIIGHTLICLIPSEVIFITKKYFFALHIYLTYYVFTEWYDG